MSSFDDDFAEVAVDLFAEFGDEVSVTEPGQDPVAVTAILDDKGEEERSDGNSLVRHRVKHAKFDMDVCVPAAGWIVTIDGEDWTVTKSLGTSPPFIRLELVRPEVKEFTRHGYRGGPP